MHGCRESNSNSAVSRRAARFFRVTYVCMFMCARMKETGSEAGSRDREREGDNEIHYRSEGRRRLQPFVVPGDVVAVVIIIVIRI